METNNHNYVLDIYKLIFTLVVALMHFESDYFPKEKMIFEGGYLTVEFFFILSGFFLYKSYRSGKYKDALTFTISRWKHFFPYTLVIMICCFVLNVYQQTAAAGLNLRQLIDFSVQGFLYGISEVLFLQMFIPSQYVNFPMWYLSVVLIVGMGYFIYLEKRPEYSGLEVHNVR